MSPPMTDTRNAMTPFEARELQAAYDRVLDRLAALQDRNDRLTAMLAERDARIADLEADCKAMEEALALGRYRTDADD